MEIFGFVEAYQCVVLREYSSRETTSQCCFNEDVLLVGLLPDAYEPLFSDFQTIGTCGLNSLVLF